MHRVNLTFLRSMRMLRLFSAFHFERYTKSMARLSRVLEHKSEELQVSTFLSVCLIVMCSSAMFACENSRQWEEALRLLREMAEARVQAEVIGCSSDMSACEKGEQWVEAHRLLRRACVGKRASDCYRRCLMPGYSP